MSFLLNLLLPNLDLITEENITLQMDSLVLSCAERNGWMRVNPQIEWKRSCPWGSQQKAAHALFWVYMEVNTLSPWEDGCQSDEGKRLRCKGLASSSLL